MSADIQWSFGLGPISLMRQDLGAYMHRWIFTHPWGEVRLHNIRLDDDDRACHDHPFDFTSFMLWGSYSELTPMDLDYAHEDKWLLEAVRFTAPAVLRRKARDLHRLLGVENVWTLVFTGPRIRNWGFSEGPGHWEPYNPEESYKCP